MRILEIRIRNFKAVKDSGAVALGAFSILIGRNASGKSSLIESLDWLGRACYEDLDRATEPFNSITDLIRGRSQRGSPWFEIHVRVDPMDVSVGDAVTYTVRVGASREDHLPVIVNESLVVWHGSESRELIHTRGDARLYRTTLASSDVQQNPRLAFRDTKQSVSRRSHSSYSREPWGYIPDRDRLALPELAATGDPAARHLLDLLTQAVFLRLSPKAIGEFAPARAPRSPRLLDEEGRRLSELLSDLDVDARAVLTEKLGYIVGAAHALDAHKPTGPSDRRYFSLREAQGSASKSVEIPAWVLSEGTRRIAALLALVLHDTPPPLLVVEEVENGLDPWTIKYLFDEMAGLLMEGTQLVVTTHSPYLLNLLPADAIILCTRTADGAEFKSIMELEGAEEGLKRMGPGDLYASHYFHDLATRIETKA